jgi:arylsulfatase A-like enzyme
MFTGLNPVSHGLNKNGYALHPDQVTLAEILGQAGYETAAILSSFVLDARFGLDQGFNTYLDEFDRNTSKFRSTRWEGHDVLGGFDSRADDTTARAIAWLEGRSDPTRRFFLFVHYFEPHEPYVPPMPFRDRFAPISSKPSKQQWEASSYDGSIAFCDHQIGRLLARLDEMVSPQETVVIVTADHGQGLMQHGDPYHSVFIYEEDVRVPLILRWSGQIPPGRVINGPVGIVDLMPTLLELVGIETDDTPLEGISLADTLTGGDAIDAERPVFLQRQLYKGTHVRGRFLKGELFGIRLGDWKYIEGQEERRRELYHLATDPKETVNLVKIEPERAADLGSRVEAYRSGHGPISGSPQSISPEDRERLEAMGYLE